MRPRLFTFQINSVNRISGTTSDYVVSIPQINALTNGDKRPDFYEVDLERIVSAKSTLLPGYYVQLAIDLPATQTYSNGANNVMFLIPVQTMDGGYVMYTPSPQTNPILVAASGLSTMLHIQLLSSTGNVIPNASLPEHAFTLTIKEPGH